MEYGGYVGKILWVNLTDKIVKTEDLTAGDARDFLGGYGLGAKVLYQKMKRGVDPLGPDNILGLISGPLTGTEALIGSRFMAVGKSPLTGMWCDSNAGGRFGFKLKSAGYDALFITGLSETKVMLFIDDGRVEILDAQWLWGKNTEETEKALKERFGNDTDAAFIGPAGERMALTSGIVTYDARICARGGLGAVMGSKRVKAVLVKGEREIPVHDRQKVKQLRKESLPKATDGLGNLLNKYGTCGLMVSANESGDAPVKNWAGVGVIDFPNAAAISDESVIKYQTKRYGCFKCPVACGGQLRIDEGKYKTESAAKIEYETLGAFGSLCLNDDVEALIRMNHICNLSGLDTIATGAAVAFCMECFEKGVLKPEDFGGIDLKWGDSAGAVRLTEMIAGGEGIGKLLADGLEKASQQLGGGSEDWAVHIKGEAFPMHDPRWGAGLATAYIADATPSRHTQGTTTFAPAGLELASFEDLSSSEYGFAHKDSANFYHAASSAGLCLFGYFIFPVADILKFFNAATGMNYTMEDFLRSGERIANVRQAFNIREGIIIKDLKLPRRALGYPPLKEGPTAGVSVDYQGMLKSYFAAMGWNAETGAPESNTKSALGLSNLLGDL